MKWKTLLLSGGALVVTWLIGIAAVGKTSNCGGNSAALGQVYYIAILARLGAMESEDHSFRFTEVSSEEREELARNSHNHWVKTARFLVSTDPVFEEETQGRRIIVVCDTPYRNVPQRWIGSAPPTHAVAYSDGSCGLISTAEFAALDLSKFRPLDELYPPKAP
jgi:hypothetical protein